MIRRNKSDDHVDSTRGGEHVDYNRADHRGDGLDEAGAGNAAEERQRDQYGGINWGAGFFGWLVAIAVTVLLASIIGAVAAAAGVSQDVTQAQAESEAGTAGIIAAVVLLVVLMIAYYVGGYVAGRMSRFDGGRQGLAVWLIGLVITVLAVILGVVFGAQYNILTRVNLPTMPIPTDTLSIAGIITALAVLLGTLLAAMAGGKVGRRYHRKVDHAAYR